MPNVFNVGNVVKQLIWTRMIENTVAFQVPGNDEENEHRAGTPAE
jgi:hypothetical protein